LRARDHVRLNRRRRRPQGKTSSRCGRAADRRREDSA
jgi:hypothetical protein